MNLERAWQEATKKDLMFLILHPAKTIQKRAWRLFRERNDVTLDDLYELMSGPKFIQKILWSMFVEMGATPDDLFDIIKHEPYFKHQAWKKLCQIMKDGRIKKGRSKRILTDIIESVPDLRKKAWKKLKKLSPSIKRLHRILDMSAIDSASDLIDEVQTFIRDLTRENHGDQITDAIINPTTEQE